MQTGGPQGLSVNGDIGTMETMLMNHECDWSLWVVPIVLRWWVRLATTYF